MTLNPKALEAAQAVFPGLFPSAVEHIITAYLSALPLPAEAGELVKMREAEHALSAAYLRLRAMIPGAFDTPHATTAEQVWKTTERALKTALDGARK